MSEKKLMKLKRSLKKRAKKLRLGKKRTGAYVFGTLRRVRKNPAKLSNAEKIILLALAKKEGWKNYKIRRKSAKPFDIGIEGDSNRGMFGADLMLSAIANFVNWTSPAVARISDYPSMAMEGDWSGIRDSSDEKIEAIFRLYVLPKFQDRMLRGNPLSYYVGGLSSLGAVRERKRQERMAKRKAEPIPGKFYTVWFSGPKGTTNKLVYTGQKLRATPMSDISRAFPVWEAPKMKKFHVAGPYDTYEQAFLH